METVENKLSDFIIAGAMKCGTSSLNYILSKHPDIFIPRREVHFYDMEDILQHRGVFFYDRGEWYFPKFEEEYNHYLKWYSSFFEEAQEGQIIGEASTTYIASDIGPKRIAEINPNAKVIVMLRDPVSRSYSHYRHLVKTGRVVKPFEKSLLYEQNTIIQRSMYKKQVENLLSYIPRNKVLFIQFEQFVKNTESVLTEVLDFLEVGDSNFSLSNVETHHNKTPVHFSLRLQLIRNYFLKPYVNKMNYYHHMPYVSSKVHPLKRFLFRSVFKVHQIINPTVNRSKKPMKPETRNFLINYLSKQNKGLNQLVGFEIDKKWYNYTS